MTNLALIPAIPAAARSGEASPLSAPQLTDRHTDPAQTTKVAPQPTSPVNNSPDPAKIVFGPYAPIAAQILAGPGRRGFRRPAVNSPREAARAYAQSRRRPEKMDTQPSLMASM